VLPGRKSVVYFSDGLALPSDELRSRFVDLVRLANRLNVSFYPVDAVGLRVHSQDLISGRAVSRGAIADLEGGSGGGLSAAQGVLRGGSTSQVFGELARETGGLVVENTNDLTRGLRLVAEDVGAERARLPEVSASRSRRRPPR
jgi:hypothetical protein